MAGAGGGRHDEALGALLREQNSVIGFLSAVFEFLARRTDFYYVPEGPYENIGFPAGVAEELTLKVLRCCDPKRPKNTPSLTPKSVNLNDDIMCSTVAQEVEIEADNDDIGEISEPNEISMQIDDDKPTSPLEIKASSPIVPKTEDKPGISKTEEPKLPPVQKDSESYNGAVRENYSWSQTIMELDVTVKLPPDNKTSKDLRVSITSTELCVECTKTKEVILKDKFPYKVKAMDSYWTISGSRLAIHLEKVQERWWNVLLSSETPIDLSKIDCSRPLNELPEDQVAKVHELQWNHERKLQGLPTSDEMKSIEVLKKAWNMEGSPFKGKEFDPSVLS